MMNAIYFDWCSGKSFPPAVVCVDWLRSCKIAKHFSMPELRSMMEG